MFVAREQTIPAPTPRSPGVYSFRTTVVETAHPASGRTAGPVRSAERRPARSPAQLILTGEHNGVRDRGPGTERLPVPAA
ncbi:hypothetical protein GCM10010207_74200 [Streptomyces atratus]|nr:hypothetical protein GCM10010207_74200 [Streptomyces atratus]